MIIDLTELSPTKTYHLMTQTVIPRPIAWVLTRNEADSNDYNGCNSYNLAPFSYFNAVASNPPLLLFSCAPKADGELKDTVKNTLREKRLVIHIAGDNQRQAVQDTAQPLDYGESEISLIDAELCDFDTSEKNRLSGFKRLREAPIAFACRLFKSDTLGNTPQTLIFAEIESIYIDDSAVSENAGRLSVDAATIAPLLRLGANQFSQLGDIY